MKNTFGTNITLTLFGESHGPEIGCVVDGLAPGLPVDESRIAGMLARRRPAGAISTARVEPDPFRVVSGVFRGRTTGTPLCVLIPNREARLEDYVNLSDTPRPGHADYTGFVKYRGFADPAGGGHFSGRLTAPLVAAGAILLQALAQRSVRIGTRIARLGGVADRPFAADLAADLDVLERGEFPVLDPERGEAMHQTVRSAAEAGDSLGGVLETVVTGLPAGLGEPWFDSVEGLLSHVLFSIPGIKGVEFGDGFALAELRGSEANDPFRLRDGQVVTETNRSGGVNGGITNGMPLVFRTAVRPTPSVAVPQRTVDLSAMADTEIRVRGRHDPCFAPRVCPVQDSLTALVLLDLLTGTR